MAKIATKKSSDNEEKPLEKVNIAKLTATKTTVKSENKNKEAAKAVKPTKTTKVVAVDNKIEPVEKSKKIAKVTKPTKVTTELKSELKPDTKTELKAENIKKTPAKKAVVSKSASTQSEAPREVTPKVTPKSIEAKASLFDNPSETKVEKNVFEPKIQNDKPQIDNRPSASKQKAEALENAKNNPNFATQNSIEKAEIANVGNSNINNSNINNANANNPNFRTNQNRPDNRLDNRQDNRNSPNNYNNRNNNPNNNPNSKYPNQRDNNRIDNRQDNRPDNRPDNRLDNRNNQPPPRKISNENPNYQTKGLDTKYGGKPNLNAPKTNPVLTKYDTRRPPERAPRFKNPNAVKPTPKPFQDFNSPISSLDTNDLKRLQEIEFKNKMREDNARAIDGNRNPNAPLPPRKNSNLPNKDFNNKVVNNKDFNLKDNTQNEVINKDIANKDIINKESISNQNINSKPIINSTPENKVVNKNNTNIGNKHDNRPHYRNNPNHLKNKNNDDIIDSEFDDNLDNIEPVDESVINSINQNNVANNLESIVSEVVKKGLIQKLDSDNAETKQTDIPKNNSSIKSNSTNTNIKEEEFAPLDVELVTNEENQVVVDLNDELENIQKTIREVKKSTINEKNKLRKEQGLPPLKLNVNKTNNTNKQFQNEDESIIDNQENPELENSDVNDSEIVNLVANEKPHHRQNVKPLPKPHLKHNAKNVDNVENNDIAENQENLNTEVSEKNNLANEQTIDNNAKSELKKPIHPNKPLHQNQNQAGINKANLNNPNNPNSIVRQQNEGKQGNAQPNNQLNSQPNPVPNPNQNKVTPNAAPVANSELKAPNSNVNNQNRNQNQGQNQVQNDKNQQQKEINRELEKAVPKKEHLPKPKPIKVTERKMTEAEFKDPFFKKILDNTYRFLRHKLNVEEGTTILVAVSGGVDSVVMMDILYNLTSRYRIGLEIAHYNHNLRGQASIDDEKFVRGLADFYGVQYHFANGNVKEHSEKNSLSIETAARGLRYKFLEKVVNAIKCSYVATAHNANDLAETFLLNLTRGSGLTGLSGIPLKRPLTKTSSVIRPIIELKKGEIIEYANRRNLEWREDHTNAETAFTRNKIRHVVLPLLEQEFNPAIIDVINRTAKLLGGADRFLNRFVNDNTNKVISEISEHTVKINIGLFKTYNHFVQGEIIQNILVNTFAMQNLNLNLIDRLIDLVRADVNARIDLTKELKAYRDRDEIIISNKIETQAIDVMINRTVNADYDLGTHIFSIKQVIPEEVDYDAENHIEYFDAQFMPQFLNLRAWKDGDSFKPIGMNGNSMKVSDLLTNEKVSAQNKRNILVLSDKVNIIWVVGYRLSEDYKVKPNSKTILKVEIISKEVEKEV